MTNVIDIKIFNLYPSLENNELIKHSTVGDEYVLCSSTVHNFLYKT